jgi:two-component sensor histidine kinase
MNESDFFQRLKFYLLILFVFFQNQFQSQTSPKIDSLLKVLIAPKPLESKVESLYQSAIKYRYTEPKKSDKYVFELFEISKRNNYKLGIGYAYFIGSFNLSMKAEYLKAFFEVEKAKKIFKELGKNELYLDAVCFQVALSSTINKQKEGYQIALAAVNDSKNKNFYKQIANLYYNLGHYELNNTQNIRKALDYSFLALENFKKTKDIPGTLNTYYSIASIYYETENYKKALEYAKFCEKANMQLPSINLELKTITQGLFAEIYLSMKDIVNAEKHCYSALTFSKKLNNINYEAAVLVISLKIDEHKNYNDSLVVKSNRILKISDLKTNIIDANYYLGLASQNKSDFQKAKEFYSKAIKLLEKSEFKKYRYVFDKMSQTEKQLNNFNEALRYSEIFHKLEIEQLKEEKENRINELQTLFEVNEKDIRIKNASLEKQKKELELQKKNRHLILLILIIVSILVLFSILFVFYVKNKKKTELIQIEKQKVTESLEERELLLKEIHHRVKNNLQIVLSLLNIQATEGRELGIDDFLEKSQSRIISMSIIHQLLYQNEQLNSINCQTYLEKLFMHLLSVYSSSSQQVKLNLNCNDAKLNLQTAIPLGLIMNELLTNSLKHAFEKNKEGNILIELKKTDKDTYSLEYKDDGKEVLEKTGFKNTLGRDLVQQLVKQMKGSLLIQPEKPYEYIIVFKQITLSKTDEI